MVVGDGHRRSFRLQTCALLHALPPFTQCHVGTVFVGVGRIMDETLFPPPATPPSCTNLENATTKPCKQLMEQRLITGNTVFLETNPLGINSPVQQPESVQFHHPGWEGVCGGGGAGAGG